MSGRRSSERRGRGGAEKEKEEERKEGRPRRVSEERTGWVKGRGLRVVQDEED